MTTLDWAINLPVVGVSGQMELVDQHPKLSVVATQGSLKGGKWLFETTPLAADATLLTGWARFDFSNSSWLIEKLIAADPLLGQGLVGASELMLLRAVRTRASKP